MANYCRAGIKSLRGTVSDYMIYVFPGSVHIFSCRRIGRSSVGIYKSLTDT
jgi:hypothetical protein